MKRIKVIIADDNQVMIEVMKKNLEKYDDIEIVGTSNSTDDEILMINSLKPDIVITDLIRNGKNSGLEVIIKYKKKSNTPKFLVITAGGCDLIDTSIMDGFINKPFFDYDEIVKQLRLIKRQIEIEN